LVRGKVERPPEQSTGINSKSRLDKIPKVLKVIFIRKTNNISRLLGVPLRVRFEQPNILILQREVNRK
jgi:hypothetical protein